MRRAAPVLVIGLLLVAACAQSEDAAVPTSSPSSSPSMSATSTTSAVTPTTVVPSTVVPATAVPTTVVPSTTVATGATLGEVSCTMVTVDTGGAAVPAERCVPADATGPLPAALVLNGCGGYEADAGITSLIARRLAAHGVLAVRLDYLGVRPAPAFTYCDPMKVAAAAPELVRGISGALATLRADPAVDPARVGAVGYSLGGLATALVQLGGGGFADIPGAGFGAIGLLSPVVPGALADQAREGKVPPLVLVVGDADLVVGSSATTGLADAARAGGVDVELQVVPRQGHEWLGPTAEAAADTIASFLASRLAAIQPGGRG